MYPGSIFVWHNNSGYKKNEPQTTDNSPLYFVESSFDKGPIDLREVSGEEFFNLYGDNMRFEAHGQPALQAANVINHGGRLLVKRLVANDAYVANVIPVAQVVSKIHAVAVPEDDINGKTLEELLTGAPGEEVDYADVISIISEVGDTVGTTKLTVSPELGTDHKYFWKETDSEVRPERGKKIYTADDYNEWDGTSDIAVPDGTKIELIEYDLAEGLVGYGVLNVVSALDHPASTSTVPDNGLNALYAISKESENVEGNTSVVLSPAPSTANVVFYRIVPDPEVPDFPAPGVDITFLDFNNEGWISWDAASELTLPDGKAIMIGEFSVTMDTTIPTNVDYYTPIKACMINVVSKLPEDDRTSESVEPIVPTQDRYKVLSQENEVKWTAMSIQNCKTLAEVKETAATLFKVNEPAIEHVVEAVEPIDPDAGITGLDEGDGTSDGTTGDGTEVTDPGTTTDPDTTDPDAGDDTEEGETPVTPETVEGINITMTADYPLFICVDNGPGVSNKAVKITADLNTSKDLANMMYNVAIYEGTTLIDSALCSLNPRMVSNDKLYGLNLDTCVQVQFDTIPGVYEAYIEHLEKIIGMDSSKLAACDLIYMTNNKGTYLASILFDTESIDFGADYGVELQNGDNGEFGDAPFGTDAYVEAALAVIDDYDALWDPDTYMIHGIFDANYPEPVKDKLAWFVTNREDTMFFRDYGIDIYGYAEIADHCNSIDPDYKNWFNAEYFTSYDIYDPETQLRERVTMMYDFAASMVDHFAKGAYRPAAGIANGQILPSAIEGSFNFIPYKKPQVNQKALIDDLRINYAIYQQGQCVVQSTYTADSEYTQLSYLNNVLAVEEVIRAVRIACPKHRFTFVTKNDFSTYAEAVNNVLKGFRPLFAELTFDYTVDPLKASQKIFNASIFFRFNNWAQTEYFDIYCLGDED